MGIPPAVKHIYHIKARFTAANILLLRETIAVKHFTVATEMIALNVERKSLTLLDKGMQNVPITLTRIFVCAVNIQIYR
jgi:hypothetical protein